MTPEAGAGGLLSTRLRRGGLRCLSLALTCCALAQIALGERYLTQEQALAIAFPAPAKAEKRVVVLTREELDLLQPRLRLERRSALFGHYVGLGTKDEVQGYAVIGDVLGRTLPITYMVFTDASLRVRGIEILEYRESHGGEVRRERFRAQFVGKTVLDRFRLDDDIRNISGATISCRALIDRVHDDLHLLGAAINREQREEPAPVTSSESTDTTRSFSRARLAMGTILSIELHTSAPERADKIFDAAFAEIDRLDSVMSDYRSDSEIARVHARAGHEWVDVSTDLWNVLDRSIELGRQTEGAFDPCMGAMTALMRDAEARQLAPSDESMAAARAASGLANLEVDRTRRRVRLLRPGTRIDLGAIGKGYALDQAAAVLRDHGVTSALFSFGGQYLALGAPPNADAWRVHVTGADGEVVARVDLIDSSLACSSNSQRALRVGESVIPHIVDPRDEHASPDVLLAAAIANDATRADAWSTAAFVLGDRARKVVASVGGHGPFLLIVDGSGRIHADTVFVLDAAKSTSAENGK